MSPDRGPREAAGGNEKQRLAAWIDSLAKALGPRVLGLRAGALRLRAVGVSGCRVQGLRSGDCRLGRNSHCP